MNVDDAYTLVEKNPSRMSSCHPLDVSRTSVCLPHVWTALYCTAQRPIADQIKLWRPTTLLLQRAAHPPAVPGSTA